MGASNVGQVHAYTCKLHDFHMEPPGGLLHFVQSKEVSKVHPINTQQAIVVVVTFVPVVEKDMTRGERMDEIEIALN